MTAYGRLLSCHHPRRRMIQYAAASRFIISASAILDRPVKPGDDSLGPPPMSSRGRETEMTAYGRLLSGHHPRRRMIQYAAASRSIAGAFGILDRPVKRGDDGCGLGRGS
jgi:hypothetical protein